MLSSVRSERGGAVIELIVTMPLLLLLLVACFHLVILAWKDIWRFHRYSAAPAERPSSVQVISTVTPWKVPGDRKSARLQIQNYSWTKNDEPIWQEGKIHREEI
jgi:hypothetical protein